MQSGQHYYFSSLQIVEPQTVTTPKSTNSRRQIYLIDKDSAVPVQAIIDQANARSAILSEDPPRGIPGRVHGSGPVAGQGRGRGAAGRALLRPAGPLDLRPIGWC